MTPDPPGLSGTLLAADRAVKTDINPQALDVRTLAADEPTEDPPAAAQQDRAIRRMPRRKA